jgi:hypothetical protein
MSKESDKIKLAGENENPINSQTTSALLNTEYLGRASSRLAKSAVSKS